MTSIAVHHRPLLLRRPRLRVAELAALVWLATEVLRLARTQAKERGEWRQ